MAYGSAADAVDEYLRLAETTAFSCLDHFFDAIINCFGDEYLRRPTPEDLQRLLDIGEFRRFPRMIGRTDCMHWEWKNCPTARKGQYTRGSGKPTIVLEAVASQDLWIWHAFFGPPACIILHNMIVEDERDGYTLFDPSEFTHMESNRTLEVDFTVPTTMPSCVSTMMNIRLSVRDRDKHKQLQDDLVENIWAKFGEYH
ncbi:PREDICTED: uncharacterized protein LOC104744113 [Camelina sativa]|uniref:Uncharacterized protein LOC104744113 n=1 Tax=Camelina sativa TaxID=90675 RepID=A0ABM0VZ45_CAMSA|nr:PREDICTED: uncharacterized protein LOC104744113 [Camelina sativa]